MRTVEELRATHWHGSHVEALEQIAESVPAVIESDLKLWALRIARNKAGQFTPFTPHTFLFAFTATRYAKRADGAFAPIEPKEEYAFFVTGESRREAQLKVEAQLVAHGFSKDEFAMCSTLSPLVLC